MEAVDTGRRRLRFPTPKFLPEKSNRREDSDPRFLEKTCDNRRDCGATVTVVVAAISIDASASSFFSSPTTALKPSGSWVNRVALVL